MESQRILTEGKKPIEFVLESSYLSLFVFMLSDECKTQISFKDYPSQRKDG